MMLRLFIYLTTMMPMMLFGYKGLVIVIPLWFMGKERDVIWIALLWSLWSLYGLKEMSGYHHLHGEVITSLGKNGTILNTNEGLLYWPKSNQYLGCIVDIEGMVYPPNDPDNPGGFNQKIWLRRHRIASVLRSDHIQIVSCQKPIRRWLYERLHQRLLPLKLRYLPEIESLIWGSQGDKNYYWYGLGVIHFLSISGLHINQLYQGTHSILSRMTHRSQWIAMGMVTIYVWLIGFPLCATRALMMLMLQSFPLSDMERYLITLVSILTLDPFSIWDLGLWYSFVAVGILMVIRKDHIYHLFLGLSLVSYTFGMEIQPLSILANYVLAPYFFYGIFPFLILGLMIPILLDSCFIWVDTLLGICVDLMMIIQKMHIPPMFYTWDKVISVLALMLLRYWFSLPQIGLLLLYLQLPKNILDKGELKLDVLSVGHGLAVMVSTQHHNLLYDIGSQQYQDVTHQVLLPFLNHERISRLDAVIISHPDHDHYSGLASLLQDRAVGTVWTSVPLVKSQRLCQAGNAWVWDDVWFEFIHPDQHDVWKGNNQSCVLKITGKQGSVLLTGDIEKRAEVHLLKQGYDLSSTLLVAPHHGSKTSSHDAFIQAVMPEHIIVSERKGKLPTFKDKRWVYPYFTKIL